MKEEKKEFFRVHQKQFILSALFIFIVTFIIFVPSCDNRFVNWDDDEYVYNNVNIRSIDKKFFIWSIEFNASNWHPLTWFSHAVDYALWNLNPLGHHLSSVILHSVNAVLVFILSVLLILSAKKNSIEKSNGNDFIEKTIITAFFTSVFFGIHPLQTESVSWVAERKNLLSGFFIIISTIFYMLYNLNTNEKGRITYYIACVISTIFALMSKPIAVTIPFIFIILDIYPLKRILSDDKRISWGVILREKIPFFAFTIIVSFLTIIAQHKGGALRTFEEVPFDVRILNAFKGIIFYIEKIFLPIGLSPVYPYPNNISLANINYILAVVFFIVVSIICFNLWKKGYKLFLVAWLYYILMLFPVIGIIQIGNQAAADRYAYLPSIVIFFLISLLFTFIYEKIIGDISFKLLKKNYIFLIPIFIIIVTLSLLTLRQIGVWKDSLNLWTDVIKKYPDYAEAYLNRANAYVAIGNYQEAFNDISRAISLKRDYAGAYNNRGLINLNIGKEAEALEDFTEAIRIKPDFAEAYANRAGVLLKENEYQKAINDFSTAIKLQPLNSTFYSGRCEIHLLMNNLNQVVSDCSKALEIDSFNAYAFRNRGLAYLEMKKYSDAISDFNSFLNLQPNDPVVYFSRGTAYMEIGKMDEALDDLLQTTQINPNAIEAYLKLGVIYGEKGKLDLAVNSFTRAISINPKYAPAYYNRGAAYYRMGKEKEAMDDIKKAARLGDKQVQKILRERGISW